MTQKLKERTERDFDTPEAIMARYASILPKLKQFLRDDMNNWIGFQMYTCPKEDWQRKLAAKTATESIDNGRRAFGGFYDNEKATLLEERFGEKLGPSEVRHREELEKLSLSIDGDFKDGTLTGEKCHFYFDRLFATWYGKPTNTFSKELKGG
jgi:hypothetical protein